MTTTTVFVEPMSAAGRRTTGEGRIAVWERNSKGEPVAYVARWGSAFTVFSAAWHAKVMASRRAVKASATRRGRGSWRRGPAKPRVFVPVSGDEDSGGPAGWRGGRGRAIRSSKGL
jgi:hypothetical protein